MNASFNEVIKTLPNAVIIIDQLGIVQEINTSTEKMFGYNKEEVIGQNVLIFIPERFQSLHDQAINDYLQTGNPKVIGTGREAEAVRRDGSSFPIHLSIGEFTTGNKRLFIGIIDDLSESNRLIKDLSLSRERSFLAQKFAQIGMWDWTIASGELYWSERIAPLFGYAPGALKTSYENFLNAIHPDDREQVVNAVNACVEKGEKYDIEHRVIWPDGTVRWLLERGDVIRDINSKPTRMLGVVQDITSRKELEQDIITAKEEAERAAHVKSIFLANMSHEIRTPMNAVVGLTDVVLETRLTPEQREHLTTVRSSANALLALLNDILDISKLESGKLTLEKTMFHLPRTLKDVLQTFRIAAREKALDLNLNIHPDLFHCLLGDPTRLRQILINLIGNGIKFTPKGSVTLTVEMAEEGVYHFTISDTGIGMNQSQIETIFDPFIQADQSTARRYGGTGLGTTISKQLVELMGGRIWAESTISQGSKFHFTVPLAKPDCAVNCNKNCPAHITPGEITLPKSKRRFNILLVEDIPANVTLASIRLEQQGHKLQIAWNGLEALEAVEKEHFDLILMDVQMPKLDGMEATRRIRAREEKGRHVPIIAMTASVMHEDLELCRQAGMDEIVPKPIDFSQLFATMEQVVPAGVGEPVIEVAVDLTKPPPQTFPDLPGINIAKGLSTWQAPEPYAIALHGFVEDYGQAAATLMELLENNMIDQAYRLTHTLKGVAGNLAIEQVSLQAEQIGSYLKHTQPDEARRQLPLLAAALHTAGNSIQQLRINQPPKTTIRLQADPKQLAHLYQKLLTTLDADNPEAAEPVLAELAKYLPEEQLLPIRRHLDNFDFANAKETARILAGDNIPGD